MADDRKDTKFGIGLMLGAVAGALAGLFLAPKSGRETREEMAKRWSELKEQIEAGEIRERVQEVFGDIKDQSIKLYQQARKDLTHRLNNLKETFEKMDKEKYQKVVGEVIEDLKKTTKESSEKLGKLRDYFLEDWEKTSKKTARKK